ncbi:hypothetical protein PIB30_028704 [Stylosanthes scabra]|uniref:Uncharacterized protein n=1 Tax=Stylosanthes scabra TaxID=79078 RepID=A0ABU6U9W1_9FABA|nr:hypothetical protein [Stylosanthes scabra]
MLRLKLEGVKKATVSSLRHPRCSPHHLHRHSFLLRRLLFFFFFFFVRELHHHRCCPHLRHSVAVAVNGSSKGRNEVRREKVSLVRRRSKRGSHHRPPLTSSFRGGCWGSPSLKNTAK